MTSDALRRRLPTAPRLVVLALAGLLVIGWVIGWAAADPAAAHGGTFPDLRYYRSAITGIDPPAPGVSISVAADGESVTLTDWTRAAVTVLGYAGEPYLLFTPAGVDENVNSLTAALNNVQEIRTLPSPSAVEPGRAVWRHVSTAPTFTWHDHRIHWMTQQRPPVVAGDPHHPHRVFDWAMQLTVDGRLTTVRGSLIWVGEPSHRRWVLLLAIGLLAAAGVALLLARARVAPRADRPSIGRGGQPNRVGRPTSRV